MTPTETAGTLRWAMLDIPALPEHVRTARNLVTTTLGDGHPCTADAALLASELVTNSVRHSDSRRPGGTVTIAIWGDASSVLVGVTDAGGESVPAVHHDRDQEGGRGLFLVEQLSARWGYRAGADGRRITWFEVTAIPACAPLTATSRRETSRWQKTARASACWQSKSCSRSPRT
jgi:anti-sigma regulatory factor (Ser/Thr protein kinase)